MKVLVATHSYAGNGAAVMLLALLEHWTRDLKWTVDVLLDLEREVPEELAQIGANVFSTADPKDYDFALVNTLISAHFLEQFDSLTRTVLWVHEGDTVVWSSNWTPRDWRKVFSLPTRIVFQGPWQSEDIFRSFLRTLPSGRIASVRNGLPPLPPNLTPKPKKDGVARIVFVGGVYGRKRPQDLVDAILELGREDVECLFIGPIDAIATIGNEHLEKIRAYPERFQLLGELDRATSLEYVLGADVFCLPSADESQPLAPLEAATLNVPCVLTDLPSYAGIWKHGENCLLGPVGDVTLLRWNLKTLLEDSAARKRVTAGAKAVVAQYPIETFFRRFDAELSLI